MSVDRAAQGFLEETDGIAGGAAGGEDGEGVVAAAELQLLSETQGDGGDAPEIDGHNEADGFAIVGDGGGDVVGHEGDSVAEGFGYTLGNVAAVAGTGEVVYHFLLGLLVLLVLLVVLDILVFLKAISLRARVREMGRRAALSCCGSGARVMRQAAKSMASWRMTSQGRLLRRRMRK